MPVLYIFSGLPGVGKTTLSQREGFLILVQI